ncbi:starch synthase [Chloropicon primus]|uniref:Starch synthase, chloroplastic/amyloplastic n=1 Tax=Chloropicon primus TaxID=1764295 RepID=A0A5B8N096_9CHLO|nr:starch synthase [Chloropicon primus]UPR05181.1 starch synthase [Chloropicon primus]|eukprot:QDZ25981.1 starch synthase [Chloropicon primus]
MRVAGGQRRVEAAVHGRRERVGWRRISSVRLSRSFRASGSSEGGEKVGFLGELEEEIEELKRRNKELRRRITKREEQGGAIKCETPGHGSPRHVSSLASNDAGALVERGLSESRDGGLPPRFGLDVIYCSAEVAPFSKTGGLADVAKSLPIALAENGGHNVTVVSPLYAFVKDRFVWEGEDGGRDVPSSLRLSCVCENVTLDMAKSGKQNVKFYGTRWCDVDWIFVDHPCFQRAGGPYGDEGGAFIDNAFRFSLLSLASIELPLQWWSSIEKRRDVRSDSILFMANDWHAAMVPVYLKAKFRGNGVLKNCRSILCIHNLFHQGALAPSTYSMLGLQDKHYSVFDHGVLGSSFSPEVTQRGSFSIYDDDEEDYEEEGLAAESEPGIFDGRERCLNVLVAGIRTCDRIVTVSSTYAWEILSRRGYGFDFGLSEELRKRKDDLHGVINGIGDEYDPSTDTRIPFNFSAEDLAGKRRCKEALRQELGLESAQAPLIGFIGRLDAQKGADVLLESLPALFEANKEAQLVMLGTGDPLLEQRIRSAQQSFPSNLRGILAFDVDLSHRIFAACDILVMPSTFEPCGLNQMISQKYGTVPVVHRVGGLNDTVEDFNQKTRTGSGFTFSPCNQQKLLETLTLALTVFENDPGKWSHLVRTCMGINHSWKLPSLQYDLIMNWTMDTKINQEGERE